MKLVETDRSKLDELILKNINPEWVSKNIGLVTVKKEDVLLKEDRVVHAAINSDSADFGRAHQDRWQKLQAILAPLSIIFILVGVGIGSYIIFQGYTNAQQATFGYDKYLATQLNQGINQTNAYNAWLYADLKSIQVYGVTVPKNLSPIAPVSQPTGGIGLPTIPSLPSIPRGST